MAFDMMECCLDIVFFMGAVVPLGSWCIGMPQVVVCQVLLVLTGISAVLLGGETDRVPVGLVVLDIRC